MSEYTAPLGDIRFLLDDVLDFDEVLATPAFAHVDRDLVDAVLAGAARFATGVLAPLNAPGDRQGSRLEDGRVVTPRGFVDAYGQFAAGGWIGLDMPDAFGGQNLPLVVQAAVAEMVNGANVSFAMLPLMLRAAARMLIAHGTPALVDTYVRRLVSGEWAATICISEAEAGSDVGRVRTRAVPVEDGGYRITGTKIFITFGDHDLTRQICHMVVARTPGAPAGTRGLSLFLVPKRLVGGDGALGAVNGVTVSRVERKMGLKASPTCVVNFDNACGYLVGEECGGLNVLFAMINTMRFEVAVQGVAVAGAATARALDYAAQRPQGGRGDAAPVAIIEHADVRRMLMIMRARTEAMRALVMETALNLDLARAAADENDQSEARALAEWLLPVCKACAAEAGFEVANLAVQVFGGHGYVSESGIEQYVRDSRVMSIYEGTGGIQALDLVTRKLAAEGGRRYRLFAGRIRADLERFQANPATVVIHRAVCDGLDMLDDCSDHMLAWLKDARRDAEAGASAYLALVGLIGGGWMWLRMAGADGQTARHQTQTARHQTQTARHETQTARHETQTARHQTKRALAEFYADYLMAEVPTLGRRARIGAAACEALDADRLIQL